MAYPSSLDTYTAVAGTTLVATAGHAAMHNVAGSAVVALETAVGTTLGTNVLKNFAAGKLAVYNTGGTLDAGVLGTPMVRGGTLGTVNLGTCIMRGGTIGTALVGTSIITGGTVGLALLGTPRITVGSDAEGDIYYRNSTAAVTRLGVGTTGQFLTVSGGVPAWTTSAPTQLQSGVFVHSNDAYQTISAGATTQINHATEIYDLGNEYNTTNKNFIVGTSGIYHIISGVQVNANLEANVEYMVYIFRNNAVLSRHSITYGKTSGYPVFQCAWMGTLSAGQTIDTRFTNLGTGAIVIGGGNDYHYLSIQRVY